MAIKLPKKTARSAKPAEVTVREALAEMGWKSDAALIREALGPTTVGEALLSLHWGVQRYDRWIATADEQDSATEIVGILQAEVTDPDLAEAWIESHQDEMTPALLAAIIRTAMEHQRRVITEKAAETRRRNGIPARMLERYDELGHQGCVGQRRDEAVILEFGGNPANLHSRLSKARKARDRQG